MLNKASDYKFTDQKAVLMNYEERVPILLKPLLEQYGYFKVEYLKNSFRVVMKNRNPNLLENFASGDIAYVANASAGLLCVTEGKIAQTASINIKCISHGDGEYLVADSKIMHTCNKLIRQLCDVYVRNKGNERLVAIAQINMSPITDQKTINNLLESKISSVNTNRAILSTGYHASPRFIVYIYTHFTQQGTPQLLVSLW